MDYSAPCKYSIRLIAKLKSLDTQNVLDFELINKAVYWARKYHGDQKRKSGEPYYSHPLEVAYMVSDYNLKTDVIVASILHDIVEDTEANVEMVQSTFGQRIAEMVDRLTRDRPDGNKWSIEQIMNCAFNKKDDDVLLIKVLDRIHNMKTLHVQSLNKQNKTIDETLATILAAAVILKIPELEETLGNLCIFASGSYSRVNYKQSEIFSQKWDKHQLPSLNFQNVIDLIYNQQ